MITRLIIAVAIFFTGFYLGGKEELPFLAQLGFDTQKEVQTPVSGTASVMLDFGDDTLLSFPNVAVSEGDSVFDALRSATEGAGIDLSYKDYGGDLGVFVEAIDEKGKGSTDRWWQFWVNGAYSQVGASSYEAGPGDAIFWKFTGQHEEPARETEE